MNKSWLTNFIAVAILMAGLLWQQNILILIGAFALSGAITNTLAVYMLFERVPGLVGSGVIPNQFESFKSSIKEMLMTQFFSAENIDRFVNQNAQHSKFNLEPVLVQVDLSPAYDRLVKVIMESSFGSMLGMFGGEEALKPLKQPFIENMQASLLEITQKESFHEALQAELDQPDVMQSVQSNIEDMIDKRLAELTPQMVKQLVQQIIAEHLGWLVVWGGVFGALIGGFSSFVIGF